MFELPEAPVTDLERFADWVELCALVGEKGSVVRAEVADIAKDSGLVQPITTDLFPGDVTFVGADQLSPEDVSEHFAELVWEQLQRRSDLFGDTYPLKIIADKVTRTAEWKEVCAYVLLLIADI